MATEFGSLRRWVLVPWLLGGCAADGGVDADSADANDEPVCDQPVGGVTLPCEGDRVVELRDEDSGLRQCANGLVHRGAPPTYSETFACSSDDDCSDGRACVPSIGEAGSLQCIVADCRTDADCGEHACAYQRVIDPCGLELPPELHCTSPADNCVTHADCEGDALCRFDAGCAAFTCTPPPLCSDG